MSEIESVARALHLADLEPKRFGPLWIFHDWDAIHPDARDYWMRLASEAIKAYRQHHAAAQVPMSSSHG